MINKAKIEQLIAGQNFENFFWIDPKKIEVAQWVRVKCMFGCEDYGLGTCPPNTPTVSECREFFSEYSSAIIIRLNKYADKNEYPSDWSREMTDKLLLIERSVFLLGYYKAFLLNQTCCTLCKDCSGDRYNCKDKKNSRPSPESFAVDVYQTLANHSIEIHVVTENPSLISRIAILLIE